MKQPLLSGFAFDPAARTIDFTSLTGFDVRRLYAVANLRTGVLMYAIGTPGLGYSNRSGAVLTLAYDTSAMSAADPLFVLYEDGAAPLPVGAATDAKVEAVRGLLATGLPASLGPKAASASVPVTLSTDGQFTSSVGTPFDGTAASDAGVASLVSLVKRSLTNWTALLARLPALVSGRVPVDGSGVTQPISGSVGATQSGSWSVSLGAGSAQIGSIGNSFVLDATVTARLGTLGQKTAAGSAPVVLASDQSAVPVSGTFWQATQPVSATALPLPSGAATSALQTTGNAALTAANQRTAYFSEASNVAVAANGVAGGTTARDAGAAPSAYAKLNGYFYSTQSGTASILGSDDNVNFFAVYNQAMVAGTPYAVTLPILFRYYYLKVANGGTAASITVKGSFSTN